MDDNEIIELDNNSEDTLFDEDINTEVSDEEIIVSKDVKKNAVKQMKEKTKKEKKPKKDNFFKRMSKKGKIIFIVSIILAVLIITAVVLYFTVFNKEEVEVENIVLESNNYIYENGKLKLLDDKSKVIGTYTCTDQDTKKCYVAKLDTEDDFDVEKYLDTNSEPIEQNSKIYNDRYVFIYDDGHISLYDIDTGKSKGNYKKIKVGSNTKDYVVLQDKDGKYGIMNILVNKAKELIDFKYEYLGIIDSDDAFVVKEDDNYYLIDITGQKLTVNYTGEIKSFNEEYVIISKDDSYAVYDYDGNILTTGIEDTIDYISINDDFFEVIIDKKLYIYDKDMTCLNPSGIKLKNTYYNKTYVFDKNNELKQTYEAYTSKIDDEQILITLSDKSETIINVLEGNLNDSYAYVNYLDGTLIFYADEAKTEKIGSYKCNNKNTVSKDSTSFDNCFIAKDEVIVNSDSSGYIPIINSEYVFIEDTKEGSTTKTIVLYNLSTNKTEVKYQKVDTGLGNTDIGSVSVTNNIIYAINTKGQYLAITIGTDGAKKIIDSSTDSDGSTTKIEKFNEYLIVTRGSKKILTTMIGEELASTKLDKIVEYKEINEIGYLVASDTSGKYTVNSSKGDIIGTTLEKYEFTAKYLVGIKDSKVYIYDLSDGTEICHKAGTKYTINGDIFTIDNKTYNIIDSCNEQAAESNETSTNSTNSTNTTSEG